MGLKLTLHVDRFPSKHSTRVLKLPTVPRHFFTKKRETHAGFIRPMAVSQFPWNQPNQLN